MPANKKPHDRRVDKRPQRNGLGVIDGGLLVDVPGPPKGMLIATKESWEQFWGSPVARTVDIDSDLPALNRLFSLYDERERCYRSARKGRIVIGSQGQPVLNPLFKQMSVLDSEIRQLEDRFGLTPMARLKLGITFGDAARSLEDLNRELDEDEGEDPRVALADPRAEGL